MRGNEVFPVGRLAVFPQFLLALSGEEPTIRLGSEVINVEDVVLDFKRYLRQSQFYLRKQQQWPSVFLFAQGTEGEPRAGCFTPLDISLVENDVDIKEWAAHLDGLPFQVYGRTLEQSRQDFLDGAIDIILGRTRALGAVLYSTTYEVEVTTSPSAGVQVMYARGHFFSTSLVFGTSTCKRKIAGGTWCFYRASETTHAGMPLWSITSDQTVSL